MSSSIDEAPKHNLNTEQIEQIQEAENAFTPEEEKKLVRRIDLFLLPTIWLMYLLSYMDRIKSV